MNFSIRRLIAQFTSLLLLVGELSACGGGGGGNERFITALSISVPAANTHSAVFDLSGVSLENDTYRVRLLSTGPSVLLDMDVNALQGGDFEVEFTLQGS